MIFHLHAFDHHLSGRSSPSTHTTIKPPTSNSNSKSKSKPSPNPSSKHHRPNPRKPRRIF
ncbi:hypothetical protein RHMOL_Rhmol12G0118600 [Rhododendron molle]|uniref:Uncharacterized protein n=1 Tax=Rhododendron molle TaxID=49168 RepID=A0ACC0LI61_RHOML|nr:hypothetical protein RHMOL_Rhmol12G0118600 [Rhododendron molle]